MNLIPIQGTSVPCEHVFSASKEMTTSRRNCLSGRTMEAMQILKFQAKSKRVLSFTEGLGEDEELADLEERENYKNGRKWCEGGSRGWGGADEGGGREQRARGGDEKEVGAKSKGWEP